LSYSPEIKVLHPDTDGSIRSRDRLWQS